MSSVTDTVDANTTSITISRGDDKDRTPISSLQLGVLPNKLKDCLEIADAQKDNLKTPCCSDTCHYRQSLEMYVHGMLHNMYIKALKLLPAPSGWLMRSILKAGHCYGCMDPVSNIIVNSIWYHNCDCDLTVPESNKIGQYNDVLDPLALLRIQVQSLKCLTELAALADPQFLVSSSALEFVCSAKCDIANMLPSSTEGSNENLFYVAAKAAGHPRPLGLVELHQQLVRMPDLRNELRSLIAEARTRGTVLPTHEMKSRLSIACNISEAQPVQAPEHHVEALRVASTVMRSEYKESRIWYRSKLEQLLKEYMIKNFWEPNYKIDIILGVEIHQKGGSPFFASQYQANFLATSTLGHQGTLFFAEFWSFSPEPRTEFCCPLPYQNAGRCYYGVDRARKIAYPDDAKYFPHDITHNGTSSVDGMLGMGMVYFSPKLDVDLAAKLSEEEVSV